MSRSDGLTVAKAPSGCSPVMASRAQMASDATLADVASTKLPVQYFGAITSPITPAMMAGTMMGLSAARSSPPTANERA